MADGAFEDPTKAVLKPRNPGESIKIKETVLKRRDQNLAHKADQARKIQRERKMKRGKKINKLITPAKLVKQSIVRRRDAKRLKNVDKKKKPVVNDANGKVLAVIRNRRKTPTDKVKAVLNKYRLQKCGVLVFLPYTEEVQKELKIAEPFVYWGFPSFKTVNDILHRKAQFKLPNSNETVVLTSNQIIEEHLGSFGILCVEDLVDTIVHRKDPGFDAVSSSLAPFQLGDYTAAKADGFKVNLKEHPYGNQGRKVNGKIQEVM